MAQAFQPVRGRQECLHHSCHLSLFFIAACLAAQDPPLRVSVTLVQVDAVVVDRNGRQVTDLTKDDFDLLEDRRPRSISHFSYVGTEAPAILPRGNGVGAPAKSRLQRENIRRTMAILVDDLKMSFESVNHTRDALKKFVYLGVSRWCCSQMVFHASTRSRMKNQKSQSTMCGELRAASCGSS